MKIKILAVIALQTLVFHQAWAATYLSTLTHRPQSDAIVYEEAGIFEQWGIPFTTGADGYVLDAITLELQQISATSPLTAALYLADGDGRPTGAALSTDFSWGSIPKVDFGAVTFTPGSLISLAANTTYVFALSTGEGGNYYWQTADDPIYDAAGGWSFPVPFVMAYYTNQYGSPAWTDGSGGIYHFMGEIDATPTPEPPTLALGLGALGVVLGLRRLRLAR